MSKTEYRRQPCGLEKKVEVTEEPGTWTLTASGPQEEGYCQHLYHAGLMEFVNTERGMKTRGWRCVEHTTEWYPGPAWREVRLVDENLCQRTNGEQGWEYVVPLGGDA